ncbi:methyl-accepting chemotaxis protein [Pseudooceanicola algae]|uniref:Uncharacterized protein n=1 Tax=Pseudooceanicola algae TaxID=1537215 RepID=A0A418SIM9_9RHOB|nr:methyl-accepting chemotaxis protein [Pseudooceanicola algae]QPM91148.1 hypothetical protein PSAL_023970 [Pseudooceanicola algae]
MKRIAFLAIGLYILPLPVPAADQFALQSNLDHVWTMTAAGLVFFMQAGFLLLEAGQVRSKNSVNVAQKNLIDFILSTVCYGAFGFCVMFGTSQGGWFGWSPDMLWFGTGDQWSMTFFTFQVVFCGTAATIVSGAVAERMSMFGYIAITLLITLLIYPVAGHWVWGGLLSGGGDPWLARLGFLDFAGSTVVHSVGAWAALAAVILIGPRFGRFDENGRPRVLHGHSPVLATAGCVILWVGWIGFNGGSTTAGTGAFSGIIMATMISGATGGVSGMILGRSLDGLFRPEAAVNGALAGLVGVTAGCDLLDGGGAALTGIGAATVAFFFARFMEHVCKLDDPLGAIAVHGAAGAFGTLSLALLGDPAALPAGSVLGQLGIQALGVGVVFVWAFGLTFLVLGLVTLCSRSDDHPGGGLRVSQAFERDGLNVSEHGASLGLTRVQEAVRAMVVEPGRPDLRIEVDQGDEAFELAMDFNFLLDALDTQRLQDAEAEQARRKAAQDEAIADLLASEVGQVLDRFEAGDFAAQVPLDGKDGVLRRLSERINDLSRAATYGLEDMSAALADLLSGEGRHVMLRRYEGVLGSLQEDFEAMAQQMAQAVSGVDCAVEAGIEGRFDAVIGLEGQSGQIARICSGLNRLGAHSDKVVTELHDALTRMAAGDLAARMLGDYSGRYAEIQECLNQSSARLSQTLVQVREAAEDNARLGADGSSASAGIRSGVQDLAAKMQQAESLLQELRALSRDGKSLAEEAAEQSRKTQGNAREGLSTAERSHENILSAEEATQEINGSVDLIEDIARQTNLLALNAAVEAARNGGSAGSGFKLVAEEVRALAGRTREALQLIRARAETVRDQVSAGASLVSATREQLGRIAETAEQSYEVNCALARAGTDQHKAVTEVDIIVMTVAAEAQQMARHAEDADAIATDVSAGAETTRVLLERMMLDRRLRPRDAA